MSNFNCEYCGKPIIDSPTGYLTGCEHYPTKKISRQKKSIEDVLIDMHRVTEGFDKIKDER